MPSIEHRHAPRTRLDKLAYIHIGPDNGGIVLNVSGEGLGFHSMGRVERNGPLRISLQKQNRRIDVCGELVWTDDVQKIGGVRFTTLSGEARDQIREWIGSEAAAERNPPSSNTADGVADAPVRRGSGHECFATSSVALPPRTRASGAPRGSGAVSRAFAPTVFWLKTRAALKLRGFSGGLAAGVLLSALMASVLLFLYGHRRQLGESLIHLGERLAAKRETETAAQSTTSRGLVPSLVPASKIASPMSAKPVVASIAANSTAAKTRVAAVDRHVPVRSEKEMGAPSSVGRAESQLDQEIPSQRIQTSQAQAMASLVKPPTSNNMASYGENIPAGTHASLQAPVPATAAPTSFVPVGSTPAPASRAVTKADPLATPTKSELGGDIHGRVFSAESGISRQLFFDLGKFKHESSAQSMRDKLAQLGLRTSVVPRGHLWMSSYQVLVGPYNNEEDERKIHGDLLSHGYKPRPFERGTRDFAFRSKVMIEGSTLPLGELAIGWESYVADATVKFRQGGNLVTTADGKWIHRPRKYEQDEYVYQKHADGSHPLVEIHFAGLDRALVFRDSP